VDFGLYRERRSRGALGSILGVSLSALVALMLVGTAPLVHNSFHSEQNHLKIDQQLVGINKKRIIKSLLCVLPVFQINHSGANQTICHYIVVVFDFDLDIVDAR